MNRSQPATVLLERRDLLLPRGCYFLDMPTGETQYGLIVTSTGRMSVEEWPVAEWETRKAEVIAECRDRLQEIDPCLRLLAKDS